MITSRRRRIKPESGGRSGGDARDGRLESRLGIVDPQRLFGLARNDLLGPPGPVVFDDGLGRKRPVGPEAELVLALAVEIAHDHGLGRSLRTDRSAGVARCAVRTARLPSSATIAVRSWPVGRASEAASPSGGDARASCGDAPAGDRRAPRPFSSARSGSCREPGRSRRRSPRCDRGRARPPSSRSAPRRGTSSRRRSGVPRGAPAYRPRPTRGPLRSR